VDFEIRRALPDESAGKVIQVNHRVHRRLISPPSRPFFWNRDP